MSLEQWANNGWLRPHKTTQREIADLLGIVDRDVKEAERATSDDWKFGIAYNAALRLCTILLNASGYRADRLQAHFRTLQSLPLILGAERTRDAGYLDRCRKIRNTVEYESAGVVTEAEAKELIEFTKTFAKRCARVVKEKSSGTDSMKSRWRGLQWIGERTRRACWRWRPRQRELFLTSAIQQKRLYL